VITVALCSMYIMCAGRLNRVASTDVTIKGVFFPKGMMVVVPVLALHMDPEVWPDPTKFKPER